MAEKAYGLFINYEFCTGCGTCVSKCPKKVILMPADFE